MLFNKTILLVLKKETPLNPQFTAGKKFCHPYLLQSMLLEFTAFMKDLLQFVTDFVFRTQNRLTLVLRYLLPPTLHILPFYNHKVKRYA